MRRLAAVLFALAGLVLVLITAPSSAPAADWTAATASKPVAVQLALAARAIDAPHPAPHVPRRVVHVAHHASDVPHSAPHVSHHAANVPHSNATYVPHSGLTTLQKRIRSCESGRKGYETDGWAFDYDYRNQNSHSSASGAWQFLDGTWNGYGGYSRAMYAPPAVQDAYFFKVFSREGTTPWLASRSCWGS